ncbi:hypothetical protein [Microbacterium sp. RU33B]|uniref:hypothetical protein n=1 Tax=Microbacterium sp. RU33B TaxID=1907390 RepID=UPI00095FBC60|nr:hypothetical protein [Microbacterium sp. RU33B]SIT86043.1 hypothetical protein SAMN05880545_2446 [Microbacterium sp. RU33B]
MSGAVGMRGGGVDGPPGIGDRTSEGANAALELTPPSPALGELQITSGGAVAVDTVTLRLAADRFAAAQDELQAMAQQIAALQHTLVAHDRGSREAVSSAWALQVRLDEAIGEAAGIAERLRRAASIYELVELDAAHQAAFLAFDVAETERIDALRAHILERYPGAEWESAGIAFGRALQWPSDLVRQATELGFTVGSERSPAAGVIGGVALGGAAIAFGVGIGMSGAGLIARGDRLRGGPAAVTLQASTTAPRSAVAPTGIADAASRIPASGAARVRVEAYSMPDGSRQFAVYVAGTRSADRDEPWNWDSNAQLYTGHESASYTATTDALAAAGARPGDTVHAVGYSQGGMIVSHLAVEGAYDVRSVITLGSPVEADVAPTTLSVGIRHADDPVGGLAGGGHMLPVGAPGSIVVERSIDPESGIRDLGWGAHALAGYTETAEMVDASSDPRVGAVRDVFAELATADEVRVFEYGATRDEALVTLAPGASPQPALG